MPSDSPRSAGRRRSFGTVRGFRLAFVLALGVVLGGCGAADVPVGTAQHPSGRTGSACRKLIDALPGRVGRADARAVSPESASAYAKAWGDPPVVLRCGVGKPRALGPTAQCTEIDGVGWFAESRAGGGYRFTTIGRAFYVQVGVPSAYSPESAALVDLASVVKRHDPARTPCL